MENSGKKNDAEKPRMDLISPVAIEELAKVLTFGAKKYAAHNWRNGIVYSRLIAAMMRHVNAYNAGETNDPETGLSHMAHAMCEAMFLLEFEKTRTDLDDRFVIKKAQVNKIVIARNAEEYARMQADSMRNIASIPLTEEEKLK